MVKIINKIRWMLRCSRCSYHCEENLVEGTYSIHGKITKSNPDYPKINKGCCPKLYPVSIYLRNLAGVWNDG